MDTEQRLQAEAWGGRLQKSLLLLMGVSVPATAAVPSVQQLHVVWLSPSTGLIVLANRACKPQCTLAGASPASVRCIQRHLHELLRRMLGQWWQKHFVQAVLRSATGTTQSAC
jgi:hypothetical protein